MLDVRCDNIKKKVMKFAVSHPYVDIIIIKKNQYFFYSVGTFLSCPYITRNE